MGSLAAVRSTYDRPESPAISPRPIHRYSRTMTNYLSAARASLLLGTLFAIAACATSSSTTSSSGAGGSTTTRVVPGSSAQLVFDPSLDVHLSEMTKTATGLYYKDFAVGTGPSAQFGDLVRVRYDVHLTNGKRIEGSDPDKPPYEFRIGAHQVIVGWDEGITGMRTGGRRQLIIPPSLGYGGRRQGEIPAGSVMVVNLQLVQIVR